MLTLAMSGRSNAQIAAERGCSVRTVANLLGRAYRKLGVRSRAHAAQLLAPPGEAGLDDVLWALSARERDVVCAVVGGASNRGAAVQLGLSASTVASYLRTAMKKLAVRSRTQLVVVARDACGAARPTVAARTR